MRDEQIGKRLKDNIELYRLRFFAADAEFG